jgi:hypothetical protein
MTGVRPILGPASPAADAPLQRPVNRTVNSSLPALIADYEWVLVLQQRAVMLSGVAA